LALPAMLSRVGYVDLFTAHAGRPPEPPVRLDRGGTRRR
jgi:hypothetical protein